MYCTGDVGYTLPDGCLVHLGRNDLQVKVRGHRVELSRIEQALLEHPDVHQVAVVAHGDTSGDTCLVAYLVERDGAKLAGGTLRTFLETRLPAYMIPATFTRLDALPLTPSGKLDRLGLPEPAHGKLAENTDCAMPRNALEEEVLGVWRDVLQVAALGIHDRFLDVGGHSLLAGKIIARIADVCECEISYREFFEHPTIAELAELLSRKRDMLKS
jgi:hypothetical protein